MDSRQATKTAILLTSAILWEEEENEISDQQIVLSMKHLKRPAIQCIRSKFSVITYHLSDSEFRRAF